MKDKFYNDIENVLDEAIKRIGTFPVVQFLGPVGQYSHSLLMIM